MWLSLFLSAARAESVIEFKTTSPVAIVVDGQQATLTSDLRQRVTGLEPGVHTLQVNGVFGKTLYEAEIDLPDHTLTTTEWARGDLKVVKTEWLPEEPAAVEVPAPAAAPEIVDVAAPPVPVAEELPVAPPVAPVAEVPPPAVAPAVAPVVAPAEPPAPQLATAMPPALQPRVLTVQATDGMRIDVVHQGRTLRVIVDGASYRIEDPTGAVLALGSP